MVGEGGVRWLELGCGGGALAQNVEKLRDSLELFTRTIRLGH